MVTPTVIGTTNELVFKDVLITNRIIKPELLFTNLAFTNIVCTNLVFDGGTEINLTNVQALLDRPIIHAFRDLKEYESSRGFTVEPIHAYFAGPVVTGSRELYDALDLVFSGHDPAAPRRREIMELSHAHKDDGATARLLKAIGIMG